MVAEPFPVKFNLPALANAAAAVRVRAGGPAGVGERAAIAARLRADGSEPGGAPSAAEGRVDQP